jgi:hypothetical protein
MATQSAPVTSPNLYTLSGHDVQVTYSTSGIDGTPHFTYQDHTQTLNFRGDEIHRVETDLGSVVSVSIRHTIDAGSTTFSLLIPRVHLVGETSQPIQTEGITTLHKFSSIPALNQGQRDFYTVTEFRGSSSHVFF